MTSPTKHIGSAILTLILLLGLAFQSAAQNVKTVTMEGSDNLKFSVTEITANPGQQVRVELTTVSDFPKASMGHNFVLLTADADATEVANKSAGASGSEYIAPETKDQIIAHTGMAGDGETVTVTFTAPEEPGEYEYICTFPGHYAGGMKGTLIVQ